MTYHDTTPAEAAAEAARYDYDCYERATRETAGAYDCATPFEPYPHDEREPGGDALALLDAMLADADPRAHDDDPPELCTPHPDAAERLEDCPTYLC